MDEAKPIEIEPVDSPHRIVLRDVLVKTPGIMSPARNQPLAQSPPSIPRRKSSDDRSRHPGFHAAWICKKVCLLRCCEKEVAAGDKRGLTMRGDSISVEGLLKKPRQRFRGSMSVISGTHLWNHV